TVRAEQQHWTPAGGWTHIAGERCPRAQLVLAFGATVAMAGDVWADLRARWPEARIVGCSTAGEIAGTHVFDDSVVALALELERSRVRVASVRSNGVADAGAAGRALAA